MQMMHVKATILRMKQATSFEGADDRLFRWIRTVAPGVYLPGNGSSAMPVETQQDKASGEQCNTMCELVS